MNKRNNSCCILVIQFFNFFKYNIEFHIFQLWGIKTDVDSIVIDTRRPNERIKLHTFHRTKWSQVLLVIPVFQHPELQRKTTDKHARHPYIQRRVTWHPVEIQISLLSFGISFLSRKENITTAGIGKNQLLWSVKFVIFGIIIVMRSSAHSAIWLILLPVNFNIWSM